MAKKSKTDTFTTEVEILFNSSPVYKYLKEKTKKETFDFRYLCPEYLDSYFIVAGQTYNALLGEAKKRYYKYKSDSEYKKLAEEFKLSLKNNENTKEVGEKI